MSSFMDDDDDFDRQLDDLGDVDLTVDSDDLNRLMESMSEPSENRETDSVESKASVDDSVDDLMQDGVSSQVEQIETAPSSSVKTPLVTASIRDHQESRDAGDHEISVDTASLLGAEVSLNTKDGYNSVQIAKGLLSLLRRFVEHSDQHLAEKDHRPTNPELVNGFMAGLLKLKVTDASEATLAVMALVDRLTPAFTDLSGRVDDVAESVEGLRQTLAKVSARTREMDERTQVDQMALGWLIATATGKVSMASVTPQTVDVTDAPSQAVRKRLRTMGQRQIEIERREDAR